MLSDLETHSTIPAKDLERAKQFYAEKLGMTPFGETGGGYMYRCGGGSWFFLYETQFAGTATHTLMGFRTKNIEQEVADLKARGVVFEEYDYPTLKTVDSVATVQAGKAAWFKDSEGNLLGLVQLRTPLEELV